jgi:hypothetical protein
MFAFAHLAVLARALKIAQIIPGPIKHLSSPSIVVAPHVSELMSMVHP